MRGNVLIIDDEEKVFTQLEKTLKAHHLFFADNLSRVKDAIEKKDIDLAIVDLNIKVDGKDRFSGLDFIKKIRRQYPAVSLVAYSKHRDVDHIQTAIQNGASEFWYKGKTNVFSPNFRKRVNQLVNKKKKADLRRAKFQVDIPGASPLVEGLRTQLDDIARREAPCFLIGESGLRKDDLVHYLYHRWLHHHPQGGGRARPPVIEDVSHWEAEELLKAMRRKPGSKTRSFLKQAQHRILFLRHVECLDTALQRGFGEMVKTHRYLRSREPFHAHLVFELEADPRELIKAGRLSAGLFYALDRVEVPPLRSRPEDIITHIDTWMEAYGYPRELLTEEAAQCFLAYDFPGNIQELYAHLGNAFLKHEERYPNKNYFTGEYDYMTRPLALESLPKELFVASEGQVPMEVEVARLELRCVDQALGRFDGKKDETARALGIASSDHLKKTYINKYDKKYPGLIRQFPHIVKHYQLS